MAKVFLNAGVVGYRRSGGDIAHDAIPAGATNVTTFDDSTNAALLNDLARSTDPYSFVGGTLRKNGSAVTINADSAERQEQSDFDAAIAAAISDCDQIIALSSPANATQLTSAVKNLAQQNKRILKMLRQLRNLQR